MSQDIDEARLLLAALAMHALTTRINASGGTLAEIAGDISKQAVAQADSLLAELEKKP